MKWNSELTNITKNELKRVRCSLFESCFYPCNFKRKSAFNFVTQNIVKFWILLCLVLFSTQVFQKKNIFCVYWIVSHRVLYDDKPIPFRKHIVDFTFSSFFDVIHYYLHKPLGNHSIRFWLSVFFVLSSFHPTLCYLPFEFTGTIGFGFTHATLCY